MAEKTEKITYTVPEAGALIGLSRCGAYDAARRGDIPTVKIGGRIYVPKKKFDRIFSEGEVA